MPSSIRRVAAIATCTALGVAAAACAGAAAAAPFPTEQTPTTASVATGPITTPQPPPTTARTAPPTAATPTTTPSVDDDAWRQQVAAGCAGYVAELPSVPAPEAVGAAGYVAAWRDLRDRLPWFGDVDYPADLRTAPFDVPAVAQQADALIAEAEQAAASGDDDKAFETVDLYVASLEQAAALVTIGGAECGDPVRAANADLNVPVLSVHQASIGFGSVWASPQKPGLPVTRIDPDTGAIQATIDVGSAPFRGQPADGRMIVRTTDA
jgi:hypothetical protein